MKSVNDWLLNNEVMKYLSTTVSKLVLSILCLLLLLSGNVGVVFFVANVLILTAEYTTWISEKEKNL